MKPKKVINNRRVWVGTVCMALLQMTTIPARAQLNGECTVTVNGQAVAVRSDGSFRVTNIPARQELVRVHTTCQIEGLTLHGVSEFFEILNRQTYTVENVSHSPTPLPTIVSLSAAPDTPTVTARADGTTYISSNNAVVTVDQEGLVEAVASGIAFITATNEGATTVTGITVSPGDPLLDVFGWGWRVVST